MIFEDASLGADAVLSTKSITTPQQLIGKSVAYEQGTTSDLLIHYLLQVNHIPFSKIKVVNAPAADAGTLLIAGKVDVAVTYQPYISNATSGAERQERARALLEQAGAGADQRLPRRELDLAGRATQAVVKDLVAAWNDSMNYFRPIARARVAIMAAGRRRDAEPR